MSPRVLVVDHYDSFTYNLVHGIGAVTGVAPEVVRNDAVTVDEVCARRPTHVVLSPGPGHPASAAHFGIGQALILTLGARIPVLGVCLGHQGIAVAFGARVVRAPEAVHGKVRLVRHDGTGVLRGLPSPLPAMRYHSLVVDPHTLPAELRVTAWSEDGLVMGLAHRSWPVEGVQFHPESIGTPHGAAMLANFVRSTDTSRRGAPLVM